MSFVLYNSMKFIYSYFLSVSPQ